ncbi:hypothetical protein [Thermanaeromonas toyohensis]|nr:hypothetical protein [Thermanaeromonas toyohensis]
MAPSPFSRLGAAARLLELGWRVRIRLDPVIVEGGIEGMEAYRDICKQIKGLGPERVTVGTLRQYPGLYRFAPDAPRSGLGKAPDGRMRYPVAVRVKVYRMLADWFGCQWPHG